MMKPLCMMKLANNADLLYDRRPCHNKSVKTFLNFRIEKSAANAACLPSLPTIPTPTSAAWIMPTSFPPSPIPRTADFCPLGLFNFTPSVRVLFCRGEHLQQITLGIFMAFKKKSLLLSLSSRTNAKVLPSMINTLLRFCLTFSHFVFHDWGLVTSSILMLVYVTFWRPHDRLMHSAVSILSPVIIQIFIFALFRAYIVSLRSYCSLSSIPVIPRNSTLF